MKYYLAIDLGASSGRHIIGYLKDGEIELEEIYRFKTGMDKSDDGLVWDLSRLFEEIKNGIKMAFHKYKNIESLSIDTWGVDYVLLNDNQPITPYYAYRNERNIVASEKVHKIIPFRELYKLTGIQFAPFNTIYQLYDDLLKGRLKNATDYLMLPNYFIYKLTGIKIHEYTEESTTSLLDPKTGNYNYEIIDKLNMPRHLFGEIKKPGYIVGDLSKEVQEYVGGNCKVILCASHDTASAFEAIDIPDDGVIISSGTWSLLGIKSKEAIINEESLNANYTNEGGVGYIRFLKNIMGMWIANKVRDETMLTQSFIDKRIVLSTYQQTFDINDKSLMAPKNMKEALMELLKDNPPKNSFDLFASIYRSMALSYRTAIEELERITNKKYNSIYIVGGGAKNNYLNNLVEKYTNKKVVALPIEATALGNIRIQVNASKELLEKK